MQRKYLFCTRAEIEKERLAVDILDLENMKLDVSKFRPELKKAETLFQQKKYEAAERTCLAAMEQINCLRASEQPLADVEKIRYPVKKIPDFWGL